MAKEKLFEVANEQGTTIKTMEGTAKVEYKYVGEEAFIEVLSEDVKRGIVEAEAGKFPDPEEGKRIEKARIEVTPTNYPIYKSRTATKATEKANELLKSGKFQLEFSVERTSLVRKTAGDNAKSAKLAKLRPLPEE